MRWMAYLSEFAQLSDAAHGWRTECVQRGARGPNVCCGPDAPHNGINDVIGTMLYLAQLITADGC